MMFIIVIRSNCDISPYAASSNATVNTVNIWDGILANLKMRAIAKWSKGA